MITGSVNARREAVIRIEVIGANGQSQPIDAVIDTGFNGYLSLPPHSIAALGLSRLGSMPVILGDGSVCTVATYRAIVNWDGAPRLVDIEAANTDPLVGMALLAGYELRIQVAPDGAVTVEAMTSAI